MIRRKLTESLKKKIKSDYRKLKQSDFDGDALSYLKKVRAAAKGRSVKKKKQKEASQKRKNKIAAEKTPERAKSIKVGSRVIEPGSKAYEIIFLSAKNTNKSLDRFIKENEKAIEELLSNYLIFFKTEIDNLIKQIRELPKKSKVHIPVHGSEKSRARSIFMLHSIKKAMLELAAIYEVVFIEWGIDLDSDMHFNCPQPGEYKNIEDGEELLDFIDEYYPNITYIRND